MKDCKELLFEGCFGNLPAAVLVDSNKTRTASCGFRGQVLCVNRETVTDDGEEVVILLYFTSEIM